MFLTRLKLAALLLITVAATVIVPVAALVPGFGGAIAPIGPSLLIGAFVFGIGMQLANGCGPRCQCRSICIPLSRLKSISEPG